MGNTHGIRIINDYEDDADNGEPTGYSLGQDIKAQNEINKQELIRSGAFSRDPVLKGTYLNVEKRKETGSFGMNEKRAAMMGRVPNSEPKMVEQYTARAFCGQYSADGDLFVTCCQDWRVRFYDTTNPENPQLVQTVVAHPGRWTLTDCQLTKDKRFMVYSSITPTVYLCNISGGATFGSDEDIHQEALDFAPPGQDEADEEVFGLWSIRFSGDDREIIGGASDNALYVYDIETKRVSYRVKRHGNHVNAVAFADESNSNVVFSGSDDARIYMWDRRSFGSARNKPEGMFIGHTEGVTYLSSKGDGVYFLSNSKDQTLKLWDVRKAAEFSDSAYRAPGFSARGQWDYRMSFYPGTPGQTKLAADNSTVTCVGHHTLSTLIRCGFSPFMQNGSRYLYCGSFDGSVCIYDLAGNMVQRLQAGHNVVRDCSWHPYYPVLMTTAWDGKISMFNHVAPEA